jgi:hypothetical protein
LGLTSLEFRAPRITTMGVLFDHNAYLAAHNTSLQCSSGQDREASQKLVASHPSRSICDKNCGHVGALIDRASSARPSRNLVVTSRHWFGGVHRCRPMAACSFSFTVQVAGEPSFNGVAADLNWDGVLFGFALPCDSCPNV